MRRLLRIDEAFLGKALHQFLDQVANFLIVEGTGILQHFAQFLAHLIFGKQIAFLKSAQNGIAKSFHGTRGVKLGKAVILGFKAALQQEIAEALDEFVEIDGVGGLSGIFSVFDDFHFRASFTHSNCNRKSTAIRVR